MEKNNIDWIDNTKIEERKVKKGKITLLIISFTIALILFLFIGIFLVSNTNEKINTFHSENENKIINKNIEERVKDYNPHLEYSKDLLTVNLKDDSGKSVGKATLKSHKSVDEILNFHVGNRVVMWYDFDFKNNYSNGLGNVSFIDLKNNQTINREWKYVFFNESKKEWEPYESKKIPKGKSKIGINVDVQWGDWVDGIWEIGGQKITKHAQWQNLNVNYTYYQIFNVTGPHNFTVPEYVTEVAVLVVAGGGGSGATQFSNSGSGAGGGAGGLIFNNSYPTIPNTTIPLFVGNGGNGGIRAISSNYATRGENGQNSTFGNLIAVGGGGGPHNSGNDGGSGGGSSHSLSPAGRGIPGQGHDGSTGFYYCQLWTNCEAGAGGGSGSNAFEIFDQSGYLRKLGGNGTEIWNLTWARGGNGPIIGGGAGEPNTGNGGNGIGGYDVNGNPGGSGVIIVAWSMDVFSISSISPINNTTFIATSPINFSADIKIINPTGNLTVKNVTLEIYNNSSLFYSDTNYSGDLGIYSWENIILPHGEYTWRVVGYTEDSNENVNFTTSENRTLTILPFSINNQIYNLSTYETDNQNFIINYSLIPNIQYISAKLNYDGKEYFAKTDCSSQNCISSRNIDIPLVNNSSSSNENKSFFWVLTFFDGFSSLSLNTNIEKQNVSKIFLEIANATFQNKTLNFTVWDESSRTRLTPMSFTGNFKFWLGNGTVKKNQSYNNPSTNELVLSINPANRTFFTDAYIEYNAVGGAYTERNYHLSSAPLTNNLQNIRLFLLKNENSTLFIQNAITPSQTPIEGALILTIRYYPEDNTQEVVQIYKTDINGKTIGYFEINNPEYKTIIMKDGVILYESTFGKISVEFNPPTLIFITEGQGIESGFKPIPGIISSLIYNKTTGKVIYTWTDTRGTLTSANLTVEKTFPNQSNEIICSSSSTLISGILICDVLGQNGTFIAKSYIGRSPSLLDHLINFTVDAFKDLISKPFIILFWLLLITTVGMGLYNPIVGMTLFVGMIIFGSFLGIVSLGWTFIWAIIAITIFIIIEFNSS